MKPSEIKADVELAAALEATITVDGSKMPVYSADKRPTTEYPADFMDVRYLAGPTSITEAMGVVSGAIECTIYCKLNPDGTAKTNRIRKIVEQCEDKFKRFWTTHFFYKFTTVDFMSPTMVNMSAGYSSTTITLEWRTRL